MNEPNQTEHEREAEDRLVDWGLRQNSGAEAAPDLTEQILTAATHAESGVVEAVKTARSKPASSAPTSRRLWQIAIAAVLLIGFSAMYGARYFQVARVHPGKSVDGVTWEDSEKRVSNLEANSGGSGHDGENENADVVRSYESLLRSATRPAGLVVGGQQGEGQQGEGQQGGGREGYGEEGGYGDGERVGGSAVYGGNPGYAGGVMVGGGEVSESGPQPNDSAGQAGHSGSQPEIPYTVNVPQERTRQETRTRTVDGKPEQYTVDVPYTVSVPVQRTRTDSYAVTIPQLAPLAKAVPNYSSQLGGQGNDVDFDLGVTQGLFDAGVSQSGSQERAGFEFKWQGKDVRLVLDSTPKRVTQTVTQNYTVQVPVQKHRTETRTRTVNGRTESYTVDVPYTVMVPDTKQRQTTVMVPEQQAPVPKLVDAEGKEIALNAKDQQRLFALIQKQMPESLLPEQGGDRYEPIYENPFTATKGHDAVSTFSIDVDTASYTNMRQYLKNGQLPPPDAVRLEELINYFDYDYAGPDADSKHPFATHTEVAQCPWNKDNHLVRVAIKGREVESNKRPLSNLVFLVDVSGSMNEPNKLPLVVDGLTQMTKELGENDRVAIVVYAGSEGLALPSTRGDKQDEILAALRSLSAGGSTAGGAGIELAYKIAEENFISGGSNRVLLCTDGDFNVGVTNTEVLVQLAESKAAETKVFLTVLGFGRGNLNDAMMEKISNSGNGNYHYIDGLREARRVLVEQLTGTLVTIAKDVKIQVEFNPANVAGYRLLGYENRKLAREDFDDDTKDAGEVGAGHTVTAFYEVIPTGLEAAKPVEAPEEEPLKYQRKREKKEISDEDSGVLVAEEAPVEFSDELLTLRLRYKLPTEDNSTKIEVALPKIDADSKFHQASREFRFATSVAGFGMLLRGSQHSGDATYDSIRTIAADALGADARGYRTEFLELIDMAKAK